jgi:hypothetical protein
LTKVFHFDSDAEQYRACAAVVLCFDHRFQLAFGKCLKRLGVTKPDEIKIAGGAKSLSSPKSEAEREFLIEQIRTSIRLHQTKRVILTLHSDCGAYGGLAAAFGGDPVLEAQRQEEELRRASDFLRQAIPSVEVEAYFADFQGVSEVSLGG